LAFALSSCSKHSTAPDANAAMYGSWSGTLTETIRTSSGAQVQQSTLHLQIGPGGVGWWINGTPQATGVNFVRDPEISFVVADAVSSRIAYTALRSGDTLSASTSTPAGNRRDDWTVTREAP
jgi:hypothetical protein